MTSKSRPRIRLTAAELDAIIAVAGDAGLGGTVESCFPEDERPGVYDAYESGMDKLRAMLARLERPA